MRANFRADLLMTGLVGLTTTLVVAFALSGCTDPAKSRESVAGSVLASGTKGGSADASKGGKTGSSDESEDEANDPAAKEPVKIPAKDPVKVTDPAPDADTDTDNGTDPVTDPKDPADTDDMATDADDKDPVIPNDGKDPATTPVATQFVSAGQTWQLLDAKMTWFEASGLVRSATGTVGSDTQVMIPCSTLHGAVHSKGVSINLLNAVKVNADFGKHSVAYDCRGYPQGLIPVAANLASQVLSLPFAVLNSAFSILTGVRATTPQYYYGSQTLPAQPVPATLVGTGCAKLGAAWRLPVLDEVSDAYEAGIATKLAAAAGKTVWTATATADKDSSDAITVALSTGVSRPVAMTGRQYVLCVKDN